MATLLGRSGVFFVLSFIALSFAFTVYGQGVSLVPNGTFETANGSVPSGWKKSYWGSPVPTFTYPASGNNGTRGVSVSLSANSSGDGNWQLSSPITVTPGATYTYSTWYKSTVATEIDVAYTNSNGKVTYAWLADIPSSANVWKQYSITFSIPSGVSKASVFQLISKRGTLTVDDVSFTPTVSTTPPPAPPPPPPPLAPTLLFTASSTLITAGQSTTISWNSTNATSCSASDGWSGTKPINGTQSISPSATTTYTLSCSGSGGSILKSLTIAVKPDVSPTPPPPPPPPSTDPNKFSEGMVTLSFDDAWASQYMSALPILTTSGIKSTFYLISVVVQNSWQDYMTPSMVQTIANAGHEIADHTISHPDLATLSSSQITNEITASRTYLQNLTGKTIYSLAYPYGSLNTTVKNLVKQAGYSSARGVDDSQLNIPSSDKYNLFSQCILKSDSLASIKAQIDKAKANKQWYILCFHEIRDQGDDYSIPPAELQQIIDYIKQVGIKTVTVSEGLSLMAN